MSRFLHGDEKYLAHGYVKSSYIEFVVDFKLILIQNN